MIVASGHKKSCFKAAIVDISRSHRDNLRKDKIK